MVMMREARPHRLAVRHEAEEWWRAARIQAEQDKPEIGGNFFDLIAQLREQEAGKP